MKIGLVHHSLRRGGGMESYLIDLVRGFRAAGDTVEVWAARIDPELRDELQVTAHPIHSGRLPGMLGLAALAAAVPRLNLRARCDAVYSLTRVPGAHVHICGGTHPGFLSAMGKQPSLKDRLQIRLERAAVEDATRVVAHSQLLANELRTAYAAPGEKVVVLYPPVDATRFRPRTAEQRAAARRDWNLEPGKIYALFPSTGHQRKGLDLLVAAVEALADPRLQLLIAGRTAGLRLPAGARELGFVRDMPSLYAAVDLVVLPSRYEPFGLVLAESLACGTPVIASPKTGCAELLRDDEGLVLKQLDVATLTEALRAFLASRPTPKADFVERNDLTISAHVGRLRALVR